MILYISIFDIKKHLIKIKKTYFKNLYKYALAIYNLNLHISFSFY